MEYQRKVISPELIMGDLLDLLDEVGAVPLVITGGKKHIYVYKKVVKQEGVI